MNDEKRTLIKSLVISLGIILLMCIISMRFASIAAEVPTFDDAEVFDIIAELDNSLWSIKSKVKAELQKTFGIKNIKSLFFEKREYGIAAIFTDSRSLYTIPFVYEDGRLTFDGNILYIENERPVFYTKDGDIIEI